MSKPLIETGNKATEKVAAPDPENIVQPDGRTPDRIEVSIDDLLVNDRWGTVHKYEDQYPKHQLSYQRHSVTPDVLEAKFMEVVMDEKGEPVRVGGDVLCKQPKEIFDKRRLMEGELSAQALEDVVESDELRVKTEPRKPKKLKTGRG